MNIIGIICEYNPFHNGHIYHLEKIKELYKDSLIILILNGYFLERGEISILSKEDKTKIALDNNIDIVVELPFIYGTQSADIFADISLKILNELKVNKIIFGSETNNIDLLNKIVDIQLNDKDYDINVKKYLQKGLNYPTAMAKALSLDNKFDNPNDLLGISYIKAIKKNNYNITPICIQRTSNYHNLCSNEKIISASNIRNKLNKNQNIDKYLPITIKKQLKTINYDKYFELLKFKIITDHNLSDYLTVDEGIENRLKKEILKSNNINELIDNIKTKRYTYNKINRMLIHILIGVKKNVNNNNLDYIKILGFNKKGKKYLNSIKKDVNIPLKTNHNSIIYNYELKASILYDMLANTNTYEFEIKNKPITK
jgi:predicted nucleotidyltransferase